MKRALIYLFSVACAVAGAWGYAYEFAYFRYLSLDVNETLSIKHYVYSGLSNIIPMLAIALLLSLLLKFFSKDVTRDDMKHFKDEMAKSNLAHVLTGARIAFVMSLTFLLLILFDLKLGSAEGAGSSFWFITYLDMQVFVGAIYLSPPHSKVAVVVAFVAAVSFCFAAGGVDHARRSSKESTILRDDGLVHIERKGTTLIATSKSIDIPLPFLKPAIDWARTK